MAFNKQLNCMLVLLRPNWKSAKDFRDNFIGTCNDSFFFFFKETAWFVCVGGGKVFHSALHCEKVHIGILEN